jgi:photosystem II stability/assembly factor-like uncharacterized protein
VRLPRRRWLVAALGSAAFLTGATVFAVTDGNRPARRPVEVQAAGDLRPGDPADPLPDLSSSSTTVPGSSSSSSTASSSSTTTTVKVPKPTTSSAPSTTTTLAVPDCAPVAGTYALGILRQPDGNGWSAGGNPALRRTTDGGATWTPACVPSAAATGPGAFRGITFAADGIHGWVVGGTATEPVAVRTVDGGQHWLLSTLPPGITGTLNGVAFADVRHGWAVGHLTGTGPANAAGGVMLATGDGGATWTSQPLPADVGRLNRVAVVDADHAWAVGVALNGAPLIVATSDRGATWVRQTIPDGIARDLRDIAFSDGRHGWAVGSSVTTPPPNDISGIGVVLVTDDGGLTWTLQATTAGSLWSLDIVDRDTLFAGGGYSLFASHDGGATWAKQVFALPALDAISFTDAEHGWVTHSMYSVVCRTDDGGRTWVPSGLNPGMTVKPCT